jgi:hypothetical protein
MEATPCMLLELVIRAQPKGPVLIVFENDQE